MEGKININFISLVSSVTQVFESKSFILFDAGTEKENYKTKWNKQVSHKGLFFSKVKNILLPAF